MHSSIGSNMMCKPALLLCPSYRDAHHPVLLPQHPHVIREQHDGDVDEEHPRAGVRRSVIRSVGWWSTRAAGGGWVICISEGSRTVRPPHTPGGGGWVICISEGAVVLDL